MHPDLEIWLVGLSHRTAPVAVRERYVVAPEHLARALRQLREVPEVQEAFVLSTCNRTEALVCATKGAEVVPQVTVQLFRNLPAEHLYAYSDVHALIHLFRVAAGLDSVVLGEAEVLGQIKRGFELASELGTLGTMLRPLLQHTLQVGKRVRTETSIGAGSLSVAKVAVDMAGHVFGRFERARALVVGAGETAVLVGRHLRDRGVQELVFTSRTAEHAQAAAELCGGRTGELGRLRELVSRSDVIYACVDGAGALVGEDAFDQRVLARRDRPLFVADLSVPRAVDPAVREHKQVLLYDLDDLGRVVADHRREREAAAAGSSEILVAEMHKYLSLRTYASFSPAIERLRERFAAARDEVLDQLAGDKASPRDVEVSHLLTRKLLDVALAQLKDSARQTRSEAVLDREYQRFLENL